jgi:hypothetical protein
VGFAHVFYLPPSSPSLLPQQPQWRNPAVQVVQKSPRAQFLQTATSTSIEISVRNRTRGLASTWTLPSPVLFLFFSSLLHKLFWGTWKLMNFHVHHSLHIEWLALRRTGVIFHSHSLFGEKSWVGITLPPSQATYFFIAFSGLPGMWRRDLVTSSIFIVMSSCHCGRWGRCGCRTRYKEPLL